VGPTLKAEIVATIKEAQKDSNGKKNGGKRNAQGRRFQGKCHHCKKIGHRESECYSKRRGEKAASEN
jgi:hypothetical protein